MIAPVHKSLHDDSIPAWHAGFLGMLPQITRYAQAAFRHLDAECRDDLIEEVIANAMIAYVRLVELGKADLGYPTVMARFAIAQIRDGRRVGCRLNIRDVASSYAQRKKHLVVERLDRFDEAEGSWREAVVEDHQTPIADQVAFRVDFPRWLATFNRRDRRIAELLAAGHKTGEVARRFGLSPGRISQKRAEYYRSWRKFHGEDSLPLEDRPPLA
jgi:hypothetical protein